MTQAATDLGCCQHGAFQQWCGLVKRSERKAPIGALGTRWLEPKRENQDCQPDCQSNLATECIQESRLLQHLIDTLLL